MLPDALSCLVHCQNALITCTKKTRLCTPIFGRSLDIFFSPIFFSVVVCIWWEYRLWLCAWLLRANVIDTECMCMKNCMHITVFLQAKICKTILYQQFECTCVCMYEHMECARQIVWFVWSSLFNAIDILANTGRCVVDRTFKYIFFPFYSYDIIHFVFIFRMDKRIMSVTHWLYHPRSVQFFFKPVQEKRYIWNYVYVSNTVNGQGNQIELSELWSIQIDEHTSKRRVAATFFYRISFISYVILFCYASNVVKVMIKCMKIKC